MSNKQKECYWDKSIDMSKATLQVDGKVVCKFDNDNQTIIVNEGFKTLRELELESRVKELEENIKTIFTSLKIANHVDIGAIQDTIWVNTYTTLWDYIRIVLNMDDENLKNLKN